jgi:hypothetical protein
MVREPKPADVSGTTFVTIIRASVQLLCVNGIQKKKFCYVGQAPYFNNNSVYRFVFSLLPSNVPTDFLQSFHSSPVKAVSFCKNPNIQ